MKSKAIFTFLFVVGSLLIAGCSTLNPSPTSVSPDTLSSKGISIAIPIRTDLFSKQAVIRVDLLNAEQLAIDASNPICVVTGSASSVVSTRCPPGTAYKNLTPEEFTFPVSDIHDQVSIFSSHLRLGEKYRIVVVGQSADGCNTTSTRFSGEVVEERIVLKDLLWATTAMGCLPTP